MKKIQPKKIYKKRIERINPQIKKFRKKETFLAILKLSLFFPGLYYTYQLITDFQFQSFIPLILIIIPFVTASIFHENILKRKKHLHVLKQINKDEIKSISSEFLNVDQGNEFIYSNHNYSNDLDIFGEKSLFHHINRTATNIGKHALANRLKTQNNLTEISELQKAIIELREKIDFRQNIQGQGVSIKKIQKHHESINQLFEEPFIVLKNKSFVFLIHLIPVLTLFAISLSFFVIPWIVPFAMFIIQNLINLIFGKKASNIYRITFKSSKILNAYSKILSEIEKENFETTYLKKQKDKLLLKKRKASYFIKRLASLIDWLSLRLSAIHFLINSIVLWDLNLIFKIEKWKEEIKLEIKKWFDVIGNVESLSSFSNLSFNNPEWVLAEICDSTFKLDAANVGHPLIPERERVCNNIKLEGQGKIAIVTGPNMAGKSTLLKTVGVNLILAFAGSAVCAKQFITSPIQLYSSMKVSDSIDKHLSLFYAELQRLKKILDGVLKKEPVFFLIDEMLKGTNALDRQKGGFALIKQLIQKESNGVIATHDLELTKLEKEFPENILNFYFDGYIKGDKL